MLTRDTVLTLAREAGFDLCGIASAERHPRLAKLQEWIASGRAGEMTYLSESLDERLDPAQVLPTVQSVISVAVSYYTDTPTTGLVSRYAWGDDYHDVMRARLTTLVTRLAAEAGPGFEAFSCVDNGPVQERAYAEQAGLGWIGKNTVLINPRLGSWLFLGEILTNVPLEADTPGVDQCGTCTRCLEACPTGAIDQPYQIDATKCLSYLTIETRGDLDPKSRDLIRDQIYGCDICQDVCPWNRRAVESGDPAWQPRDPLSSAGLVDLCRLSDDAWRALMKRSAMRRAGLRRIRRTLAYAAQHASPAVAREALDALAAHPSSEFPEVRRAIHASGASEIP